MDRQPTGTVTFLFTDIEGSTRLWEQYPEAMRIALARHDALLRQAIESHGGFVFKTIGDAFCAAFPTAPAALAAALAGQRALSAEGWAETPIRVRMGLHTGIANARGGDYFGPVLNRVGRIVAAGHGGQILLSLATQELVRDQLPAGIALRDMGDRRLRDLIRPERLFQVIAPDLPKSFPPLRTLDYRPNNLPAQTTSFVGREAELSEV
ncbi:MAG: adenylate/guanylate cyclase domain-containing protein, partial [Chloroflexia bacterium]|nr:adenylate/guanylate cyclase domain-containing protein [Chloroflexia bacterium]